MEKRGQPLTTHIKIKVDPAPVPCYAVSMMKVGDLVRFDATDDQFNGAKGIIVRCVHGPTYRQGLHYEVQTFDGHIIIALDFELEWLENEVEIPN